MANLDKAIQKKRSKLLLDFFFNIKRKLALILFIFFAIFTGVAFFAHIEGLTLLHLIFGSLAALFLLLFLLCLLRVFTSNITPEELEKIMSKDKTIAYDELFKNFGLKNNKADFVSEPIEFKCPETYPGRKAIVYRYINKSKKIYYSQVGYTWIFFGKNTLFYYHSSINFIHGYVGFECAEEVNYKDIVSIKTVVDRKNRLETMNMFLSLKSGNNICIKLRAKPTILEGSTTTLTDQEVEVVSRIRLAIRENK